MNLLYPLVISDSLFISVSYLKNLLLYFFSPTESGFDGSARKELYQKNWDDRTPYLVDTFHRYLFYTIFSYLLTGLLILVNLWTTESVIFLSSSLIITLPSVQASFLNGRLYQKYLEILDYETDFLKYILSKIVLKTCKNSLDFVNLTNLHVIALMKNGPQIGVDFLQTLMAVGILYLLRINCDPAKGSGLYLYYKVLKLGYFYETGFMFQTMTVEDAKYLLEVVVREQRWNQFGKAEVVNSILTLSVHHFIYKKNGSFLQMINFKIKSFLTIWTLISVLKLYESYLTGLFLTTGLLIGFSIQTAYTQEGNLIRDCVDTVVVSYLFKSNLDLLVVIYLTVRGIFYKILREIPFFINNYSKIKENFNSNIES
jgi:hypothetical protein